jgi:hypothetical protein
MAQSGLNQMEGIGARLATLCLMNGSRASTLAGALAALAAAGCSLEGEVLGDLPPSHLTGADAREPGDPEPTDAIAGDEGATPADLDPSDPGPGDPGCVPSCLGRCGGVSDGCGGSCAAPCRTDQLLHADGPTLVDPSGAAVDFRGAISCCGGGFGWPLFDEAWVDEVAQYDVTFLHMRLGPFLTGEGGESDWAAVGGPYVDVGGRADLTRFNAAFWAHVRYLIEYAAALGIWVEVDVADGWAIKHCRWGDIPEYSAWAPGNNAQGEDWCDDAGSREILGSDVHDAWVRQVVHETGRYANVIYQDGNEIGLVADYAPEWTLSIRNIIHDQETRDGYARHLFGSNSGDAATLQAPGVDFVELHQSHAAAPGQCFGKPCLVNEYNPNPPLSPAELYDEYCAGRAAGTYFWYWRHGQSEAQMAETLALIASGC